MTELKAHLVRAVVDWALELGFTPHVMVDATFAGVQVPDAYVKDGRIVFNVSPGAVRDYLLDDQGLHFSARFSGQSMHITIPLPAILAIYAKENNQGISFPEAPKQPEGAPPEPTPPEEPPRPKGPHLRIVK